MRRFSAVILSMCVLVGAVSTGLAAAESSGKPMNILFFLVDDLGTKDIVANRNPATDGPTIYETPAMDKLAADGVNFTQAYANGPRCVVSRISMMTGCYHFRPFDKEGMPKYGNQKCIAELLQGAGYNTGYLGKWHLGYDEEEKTRPVDRGFAFNKGSSHLGSPGQKGGYFAPYNTKYIKGFEDAPEGELVTERLTAEAIGFLQRHAKEQADKPFMLCVSHYAVHMPIEAKPEDVAYFKKKLEKMDYGKAPKLREYYTASEKLTQDNPTYAAMVQDVDESLAAIRAELERLGMADNTVIVLTSDHGGKSCTSLGKDGAQQPTSNFPLRTGKGWLYEGGIRIPFFVYWPGKTVAGAKSEALVLGSDLYNSFLEMANMKPVAGQGTDSISFVPTLSDPSLSNRKEAFFSFYTGTGNANTPMAAYRKGDYKYVYRVLEQEGQLFHIGKDEGENEDLAKRMPDLAASMNKQLFGYLDSIGTKPYKPKGKKHEKFLKLLEKANVDLP